MLNNLLHFILFCNSFLCISYMRSSNSQFSYINIISLLLFRVQAIGLLIAVSRVGAAFSPFIMNSLKYINESLPFVSLGLLNLFVGFLCLHLRETKNTPIPDTIDDSIMLMKKDGKHPH